MFGLTHLNNPLKSIELAGRKSMISCFASFMVFSWNGL